MDGDTGSEERQLLVDRYTEGEVEGEPTGFPSS
jgi:hypothetical protein